MVYDIESLICRNISKENFVIDTNVLYWMFYGKCTFSNEKRQKLYPSALVDFKVRNNCFYTPATCLFELFSIIEKNEYRLFCARENKIEDEFKLKDYRKIREEREQVAKEIEITYKNIKNFIKVTEQTITKEQIQALSEQFSAHVLDVYDRALVDFCTANDFRNIITDDGDYMSADRKINIYTANRSYFQLMKQF